MPATHLFDRPFQSAYASQTGAAPLVEHGFSGLLAHADAQATGRISAWLPGDRIAERLSALHGWKRSAALFRFLFAEKYFAPAMEAHRLFSAGHLGNPVHFLAKVQVHRDRLLNPGRWNDVNSWLREPALNRLPLAMWMMGPVSSVRVVAVQTNSFSRGWVVLLRHRHAPRMSILELSVSSEQTQAGLPAIADRFECTGSDGFIEVNGIWGEARHAPRIAVHRAADVIVKRDLRRDFAQVYENAAAEQGRWERASAESYTFAEQYLDACAMAQNP